LRGFDRPDEPRGRIDREVPHEEAGGAVSGRIGGEVEAEPHLLSGERGHVVPDGPPRGSVWEGGDAPLRGKVGPDIERRYRRRLSRRESPASDTPPRYRKDTFAQCA